MHKTQKISELHPTIGFTEFDIYRYYYQSFLTSELGQIYGLFPFSSLAKELGVKESTQGRTSYFPPESKIALMIPKSYTNLSDQDLICQLKANINYRFFCSLQINPLNPLSNFKIMSDIRCEIAREMDIDALEGILASH